MASPSVTPDTVAAQVRAWVHEQWEPDRALVDWRRILLEARWAVPSWPQRWWGRDWPSWADDVVAAELRAAGAVGGPVGAGPTLAGPTILAHGPDPARARFLGPLLTGEETWCQLFSEPGAGSDLAGLTTTAIRDGDRWIVNGQKVWNTSAHHADYGILVARTNWDVPKHRGLSYFALPMRQPGVEVRPLRQMNFHASFNEVFLTDAEIPADHLIGEEGGGWAVALTTLAFERRFAVLMQRPRPERATGRAVEEAEREAAEHVRTYSWYPQRAGRADLAVDHARRAGRSADPLVRQQVARLIGRQRASGWTAERAQAARTLGRPPGAEGSIGKLALSEVAREAAAVHTLIGGSAGLLAGTDPAASYDGLIAEVLISVPAQSIAGGTDEIQRNILGEKILGLPREPAPDRDLPFRDVPRNA
jgi:alkylation response protein AidB-like acyl-CoA dehydrogenase